MVIDGLDNTEIQLEYKIDGSIKVILCSYDIERTPWSGKWQKNHKTKSCVFEDEGISKIKKFFNARWKTMSTKQHSEILLVEELHKQYESTLDIDWLQDGVLNEKSSFNSNDAIDLIILHSKKIGVKQNEQ